MTGPPNLGPHTTGGRQQLSQPRRPAGGAEAAAEARKQSDAHGIAPLEAPPPSDWQSARPISRVWVCVLRGLCSGKIYPLSEKEGVTLWSSRLTGTRSYRTTGGSVAPAVPGKQEVLTVQGGVFQSNHQSPNSPGSRFGPRKSERS